MVVFASVAIGMGVDLQGVNIILHKTMKLLVALKIRLLWNSNSCFVSCRPFLLSTDQYWVLERSAYTHSSVILRK